MLRKPILCLSLFLASLQCVVALATGGGFEILSVAADTASEEPEQDILHLAGSLRLETREWLLEADRAVVRGPANRPLSVRLEGSPVRLISIRAENEEGVQASAPVMEYNRSSDSLLLSGGAELRQGEQVLRSASIEYDVRNERFHASGAEGVTIEAPPVD